jgi:hypothetical protein
MEAQAQTPPGYPKSNYPSQVETAEHIPPDALPIPPLAEVVYSIFDHSILGDLSEVAASYL